jgi:hypothetical protein
MKSTQPSVNVAAGNAHIHAPRFRAAPPSLHQLLSRPAPRSSVCRSSGAGPASR